MSQLSTVIEKRSHCLDALERIVGIQPALPTERAALTVASHCLKFVTDIRELEGLYSDLCALDSARAGDSAPALAGG